MAKGRNTLLTSRIHDCSQFTLSSILLFKKALTQAAGPYMRLRDESCEIMQRGFIVSDLIIDESCQEMSESVDRITMSMMDQGIKRFERREYCLNKRSFHQHELICGIHQDVFHISFNFGNQCYALFK